MKQMYLILLDTGKYTLNDIDEMDFWWYLELLAYKNKDKNKLVPIDQIF